MKKIIVIPFEGFYYSEIDSLLDMEVESFQEHDQCFGYDSVDWPATKLQVAIGYAETWLHVSGLSGDFHSLKSPRFYNFQTDEVFVEFPDSSLTTIKELCLSCEDFSDYVSDTCSSSDGFISFVENKLDSWPESWNTEHYQVALNFLESVEGYRESVLDSLQSNGGFELVLLED